MDRRTFLRLSSGAAALAMGTLAPGIRLAGAQRKEGFADLGLPELKVHLDDKGYTVSPASTLAGWTVVTLENKLPEGDNSADIMLIPAGHTPETILKENEASQQDPAAGMPTWLYEATFTGAPWVPAGTSGQALILLMEGDWMIYNGGPVPLAPATLQVTAGEKAAAPAIKAEAEITMQEFAFIGLDKPLAAGEQIWKVTNAGHQPHLMTINRVPEGTTREQLVASMMAMLTGQPDPNAVPPDQMPNVGGLSSISKDQTTYLALDLPAGSYGATCFFPDHSGQPHMMLGMTWVFTVQ